MAREQDPVTGGRPHGDGNGERLHQPRRDRTESHDEFEYADSDDIRHRIRQTRSRLDRTVDEVVDRLRPRTFAHELAEILNFDSEDGARLRRRARSFGNRFVDQISANPVPTALIGAGVLWLAFGGRSESDYDHDRLDRDFEERGDAPWPSGEHGHGEHAGHGSRRGRMRERLGRMKESVKETFGGAKERVGSAAARVGSAASRVGSGARGAADRTGAAASSLAHRTRQVVDQSRAMLSSAAHGVRRTYRDTPLVLGAGAVAIGIVCGLLLPRTRTEDEAMGDYADEVKEKAARAARRAGRRASRAGAEAGAAAVDAATERLSGEAERAGSELAGSTGTSGAQGRSGGSATGSGRSSSGASGGSAGSGSRGSTQTSSPGGSSAAGTSGSANAGRKGASGDPTRGASGTNPKDRPST